MPQGGCGGKRFWAVAGVWPSATRCVIYPANCTCVLLTQNGRSGNFSDGVFRLQFIVILNLPGELVLVRPRLIGVRGSGLPETREPRKLPVFLTDHARTGTHSKSR